MRMLAFEDTHVESIELIHLSNLRVALQDLANSELSTTHMSLTTSHIQNVGAHYAI